jgi:hypothetical protein
MSNKDKEALVKNIISLQDAFRKRPTIQAYIEASGQFKQLGGKVIAS